MRIEDLRSEDERESVVTIEGLERALTLVHITDSHVSEADERDPRAREFAAKYQETFEQHTPNRVSAREVFEQTIERSRRLAADCTILTGDIIHFPSRTALEILKKNLASLRGPYLYTLGNHDWHFPYLESNDDTREAHYNLFAELTGGDPAAQVVRLGGVRLVALDNSNYRVTRQQLDFLRSQLQTGEPCLLFIHIPLYIESLAPSVIEKWGAPIMMGASGWPDESRSQWKARPNDKSTTALLELLTKGPAENLVGIFCGHVHFAHADEVRPGRFQYVSQPGFTGGYRVIRLKRAD